MIVRIADPTAFYFQRYFAPPLPLLLIAVVLTCGNLTRRTRGLVHGVTVVAVVTWLFGHAALRLRDERARYDREVTSIESVQVALGHVIAERTPKDAVIWSQDAGAPRYFGRRRTVDLCRLNTPELLTKPELPPSLSPALVVVAPAVFDLRATDGLENVIEVSDPEHPNDRYARQIAARCRGTVVASYHGVPIASAACGQDADGAP
jgi:hypothetical protein